jgi:hypothetical protein
MSIISAILAKVLADRKGLPPEVANRFLVTGYVVGSATSPILSAIVSERLTQQEADKLVTSAAQTPSTPETFIEVPPIEGLSPEQAKVILKQSGFKFKEENEVRAIKWLSEKKLLNQITASGDIVFDQEPEAGTLLEADSDVTMFILRQTILDE